MRRAVVIAIVVVACKGKTKDAAQTGSGSNAALAGSAAIPAPPVDWKTCDAALRKAATQPLDARPSIVIAGCKVCGDWTPLLKWSTPQAEKGPTRAQIEAAMATCGYCDANAKQRFLGTLDNARGTNARTPWRFLGEQCKAEVSAVPDNRFTTAPFYALDRIARAAAAHGGETANLLAALELPLPAVSITGNGIVIPDIDPGAPSESSRLHSGSGVQQTAGPIAITLIAGGIQVAKLPRARLGASGVAVELGNYPGDPIKIADLGEALKKLAGDDNTASIALLAPTATPAEALLPILVEAAKVAPVYLAVNAPGAPEGWDLPGTIPIALDVGKGIDITPELTTQNLATELAKHAAAGQKKIGLQRAAAKAPAKTH